MSEQNVDRSRRAFLVKAAYAAPLIVTLNVMPSIASAGSPVTRTTIEDGAQRLRRRRHRHKKWHSNSAS